MYLPRHFAEGDTAALHQLMGRHDFAVLVTTMDGAPFASHLPLLVEPGAGLHGTILGHMSRANTQWRGFAEGVEALAIFQGPHAYISPSWYASEPAVPTWNYAAVHAYGTPKVIDDHDGALAILERLVAVQEAGRPEPWSLDQVPDDFRDTQMRGITAFEMPITRLEGKFKMGQNKPAADRLGAAAGLRATGDPMATEVAKLLDDAGDVAP
jgi:transcriptional regulator